METKWLRFVVAGQKPKTTVWCVVAKEGGATLGRVAWFGRWRKYAFAPNATLETFFEEACLRDIAQFCEERTREHRQSRKQLAAEQ